MDIVWISGGGNEGAANCRPMVQRWMEQVAGVGGASILPKLMADPADAGWMMVAL